MATATQTQLQFSPYYTMNTVVNEKEKEAKTNRTSVMEYSYTMPFNMNYTNVDIFNTTRKDESRSNRISEFVKSQMNSMSLKDQLKQSKMSTRISENMMEEPKCNLSSMQVKNTKKVLIPQPQHNLKISKGGSVSTQLSQLEKKYFLPLLVQSEKDIIIIHYRSDIKHIVYNGVVILVFKSPKNLFRENGDPI